LILPALLQTNKPLYGDATALQLVHGKQVALPEEPMVVTLQVRELASPSFIAAQVYMCLLLEQLRGCT
jgi:hypothetical protein